MVNSRLRGVQDGRLRISESWLTRKLGTSDPAGSWIAKQICPDLDQGDELWQLDEPAPSAIDAWAMGCREGCSHRVARPGIARQE